MRRFALWRWMALTPATQNKVKKAKLKQTKEGLAAMYAEALELSQKNAAGELPFQQRGV